MVKSISSPLDRLKWLNRDLALQLPATIFGTACRGLNPLHIGSKRQGDDDLAADRALFVAKGTGGCDEGAQLTFGAPPDIGLAIANPAKRDEQSVEGRICIGRSQLGTQFCEGHLARLFSVRPIQIDLGSPFDKRALVTMCEGGGAGAGGEGDEGHHQESGQAKFYFCKTRVKTHDNKPFNYYKQLTDILEYN